MENKSCHDKRRFYDRKQEPLNDQEWFEAERTGEKQYYLVRMHNGGRCVKLYTEALASLVTRRTGLSCIKIEAVPHTK